MNNIYRNVQTIACGKTNKKLYSCNIIHTKETMEGINKRLSNIFINNFEIEGNIKIKTTPDVYINNRFIIAF